MIAKVHEGVLVRMGVGTVRLRFRVEAAGPVGRFNRWMAWGLAVVLCVPFSALAKEAAPTSSPNGELARLVAKWNDARKQGPPSNSACESAAKDFDKLGNSARIAEGHFNAGVVWEACGNLERAKAAYRQALAVNAKFAPAMVNLGQIAFRSGDLAMAQQQFDAARTADSKNVQAYHGSALVLFDKARMQNNDANMMREAIAQLRRALALDAESMPAYSLLALIYYTVAESDRSKLDLAELVCKQANEISDKYPQIYNTLGLIKLRKSNVTAALREFRTAVQLDPKYVEAQLNIGAITLSARDYKAAEEAFRAVLDSQAMNPTHVFDATMGMAVALRGQRRIDEAEQWYGKAKALQPKECSISYNFGILYQDYKSSSEADLTTARKYFTEFSACKTANQARLQDAMRRIKDIDETFKALAEQKKIEEENRKIQEEMERQQQQQQPAPGGSAPPAEQQGK